MDNDIRNDPELEEGEELGESGEEEEDEGME